MAAFDTFKKSCVVVALETKQHYSQISPVSFSGLTSPKAGNTYPYGVVTSADQDRLLHTFSYKDIQQKKIKNLATNLKNYEPKPIAMPAPNQPLAFPLNATGSFRQLYLVSVKSENEFIASFKKGAKGQTHKTKTFLKGTQNYIKLLDSVKEREARLAREKAIKDAMPELNFESWTNSEGKTLIAKYSSLNDDQITIELKRGNKEVTFALSLLDQPSQARAQEITAQIKAALKKASAN